MLLELLTADPTPDTLTELLREVIDPELGINIVDLGLLREVDISPRGTAFVVTTLTTPACPLGPYITEQITDLLLQVTAITDVEVQVVWSPPWDPDRDMTDAAKQLLGWRHRGERS
jgi:metal-sulfur cluster biosynthetic enzyme